jgi:hypothetical protein
MSKGSKNNLAHDQLDFENQEPDSKKHLNNQDYDSNQMGKLEEPTSHMYQEAHIEL